MNNAAVGGILAGLTYLLISAILIAIPVFIIYKLIKKLITYKIETEHKYDEYYKAKKEFENVEADLKRHLDEDGYEPAPKEPFTQADMREWEKKQR